MLSDQPAPPRTAAAAGLLRRLASLCYEVLLLAAILLAGGWIFLVLSRGLDPALARPLFRLYLIALTATYFVYCWTHGGQTLPMRTWRIRLVAASGSAITLGTGLRRYLYALIGCAACGLGYAWALVDPDHQFLHDRLAHTRLIAVPPTTSSPPPDSGK